MPQDPELLRRLLRAKDRMAAAPDEGWPVFRVHTDIDNGPFRWLPVQHPEQPHFQLGLFVPGAPLHDPDTEQALRELVAKGAMPGLILHVADCRAEYERMRAAGVELTQEPIDRFGNIDAGFRDPSGNGWKVIQLSDAAEESR